MGSSPTPSPDPGPIQAAIGNKRTPRRRITNKPALTAGKPKDPSSFVSLEGSESEVAAYCGCNDIGVFRRFYLSGLVLPFYVLYLKSGHYKKKKVLTLLGDLPESQYWASDDDPAVVYPFSKTENVNYRASLIAHQLLRGLRKGIPVALDPKVAAEFSKATACRLPETAAPLSKEQVPTFGPFTGECELEALNRCLNLFAHIKHTTNKSQWGKRFFGKAQWDATAIIGGDYLPHWMRTGHGVQPELPDEYAGPAPTNQPRPISVRWKRESKNKKHIQYVAMLQDQDNLETVPTQVEVMVERSMVGAEIRDRIREAFRLHEFDGQLCALTFIGEQSPENDFSALEADWKPITERIFAADAQVRFWCIFEIREDGESPWEYAGPPAQLRPLLDVAQGGEVAPNPEPARQPEQVQQLIFAMTVPKGDGAFEPLELFRGDTARMIKCYDGYDVSNPLELQKWQVDALQKLAGTKTAKYNEDSQIKAFRKLKPEQVAALTAANVDGALETVDDEGAEQDDEDKVLMRQKNFRRASKRYYAYQAAVGGTESSVGPPIETSARALQMTRIDDNGKEAYAFDRYTPKQITRHPKPYQVNGAAWGLSKLYGEIPFADFPDNDDDDDDWEKLEDAQDAAKELRQLQVPGIMIQDQTGLGKSVMAMQIALGCGERPCRYKNGRPVYRPIFLAAPQNLIRQWAREIILEWPEFELVISYDDGQLVEPYYTERVISSSTVKAFPEVDLWPDKFFYLIDDHDVRNARTIWLTTPETNVERSLYSIKTPHPAVPFDPPKFDKFGKQLFKAKAYVDIKFYSRMSEFFSTALIDESSKIKTRGSKRHLAIELLKAERWVFISATAMINMGTCILGPLSIIWAGVQVSLAKADPSDQKWVRERVGQTSAYSDVAKLEKDDIRRLVALNPQSAKALLQSNDSPLIARYFPIIEELIVLRRSTSSRIPRNQERTSFYNIRDEVKRHFMKTRILSRLPEEDTAFEWLHRDAAKRFIDAKCNAPDGGDGDGDDGADAAEEKVVFGTAEMRELLIITGSTHAALFNMVCNNLDSDTLVKTLDQHRVHGWTAFDVVKFLCKAKGDAPPTTALEYANFMVHGSPMLRGLLWEVFVHIRDKRPGKILVTEEVPLLAWWFDLTLNLLGIKTTTFHSGLTSGDRDKLVLRFNDPKDDLMVMILPYDVGALGMNLQADCSNVVVMGCAKNQGTETQAVFRPIRVNSPREVHVVKMFVQNSMCAYREAKKTDKYLVELATRANDPHIQELAVDVLNEHHREVQAAQDLPSNREFMTKLREAIARERKAREDKKAELAAAAKTIPEKPSEDVLDAANVVTAGRLRKKPERFEDVQWSEGGRKVGVLTEEERLKREAFLEDIDSEGDDLGNVFSDAPLSDASASPESDVESEYNGDSDDTVVSEEARERRLTDKQMVKLQALERKRIAPVFDEGRRVLARKLMAPYDRVYTMKDLREHKYLNSALRLIHCKKTGVPVDYVPNVHIKYNRFTGEELDDMETPFEIDRDCGPLLKHLLAGRSEHEFKQKKKKKKKAKRSGGDNPEGNPEGPPEDADREDNGVKKEKDQGKKRSSTGGEEGAGTAKKRAGAKKR